MSTRLFRMYCAVNQLSKKNWFLSASNGNNYNSITKRESCFSHVYLISYSHLE